MLAGDIDLRRVGAEHSFPDEVAAPGWSGEPSSNEFNAIDTAGLSTKQLMVATGMSAYYVRKGLLWIKETAALQHTPDYPRCGSGNRTVPLAACPLLGPAGDPKEAPAPGAERART
ncbi:hypothetical protein ACQP1W_25970 [Spirillospora sp. CA-255316]